MGFKYFPFDQSMGYDANVCATACWAQTDYNSRHPAADGSYMKCVSNVERETLASDGSHC